VGVAHVAVGDRALQRLLHDRRRREVRLAIFQVDDVDPLALHRLAALGHFHGEERLDLGHPPGEAHRPTLVTRPRARRICSSMPGLAVRTPTLLPR